LRYVYEKNELGGIFPKKFFRDELGAWWYSYCINRRARDGLPALWSFWSSPLSRHANISIYQKIKLIGACLLKYNPEAKNG